ncbi:MAG: ATP-binding protein [Candidatus Diapherotrites archaeon]|nr:ATP-binding protein [Candidatus Diapherotrites archaeon]
MALDKELGTIVSTPESPSPSALDFVVTKGVVHRGQFVELEYPEGIMIAWVLDVFKTNKYFERADAVKEFESNGSKLNDQFPVSEWEFLMAKAKPLGVFLGKQFKRPSIPPSPGTKVFVASDEHLISFLGLDMENGLLVGSMEFHDVPVKLNLTRLLQKHCAVLAMSGAGKSIFCTDLLEELLFRKREAGRLAAFVFDVHGEYSSLAEPAEKPFRDFSNQTRWVKARDIKIAVSKLSPYVLAGFMPNMSSVQKRELARVFESLHKSMRDGNGPFDLRDVRSLLVEDKELKDNVKTSLLGWLHELEELKLFDKIDRPSIVDLAKPGTLSVIDLSDITNLKKKQVIVSYFSGALFYLRRDKKVPPVVLVVEESHQFIPEGTSKEGALSKSMLRTIAREGRKFGCSLCLVSQRPIQLDTTTLSQCNTHVYLRITNPYDLDHIAKTSEGFDSRSTDIISSLKVGEALIAGEALNFPVFLRVRQRLSQPSKHERSLEQAAREFEESSEKARAEAKEFL